MIATVEISRIFKTDCIDNNQVCCIADALIDLINEGFACRFVNKQLDDSEITGVIGLPSTFPLERLIQVNQVWKRQTWQSKHRLVSAKTGSMSASGKMFKVPSITIIAQKDAPDGSSAMDSAEVNRIVNELVVKLDNACGELKLATEAKARADADIEVLKRENSKLSADLNVAQKDVDLKGRSLEAAKKKMVDAIKMTAELKAEKEKNEAMLSALKAAFPEDVYTLGAKLAKDMPDTVDARRVIYLYLAIITARPIEGSAFGNRFKLFDDELYSLFKHNPNALKQAREMFAADINARLTGQRVTWDFLGEPFDTERFSTSDSFGTEVTEVISALITKLDGLVIRRAKVKTEEFSS